MTFALQLPTITAAIAGLTISGVKIKDYSAIASDWKAETNTLFAASENGFITNFSTDFEQQVDNNLLLIKVSYTLNYRFIGTQLGSNTNYSSSYSNMIAKFISITTAIVNAVNSVANVKIGLGSASIGEKTDPAGNQFFGVDFSILIEEI